MRFATLYDADPGPLARRPAPTERDWGFGAPTDLTPTSVHFERGVSLPMYSEPFRRRAADEAGADVDNLDDLVRELLPEGSEGQVGGYSILPDEDACRSIAFRRLGRPDLVISDRWDSVEAFDHYLKRNASSPDLSRLEARRPDVEWIDAHRNQIAAEAASWRLLMRFQTGVAGLDIGDAPVDRPVPPRDRPGRRPFRRRRGGGADGLVNRTQGDRHQRDIHAPSRPSAFVLSSMSFEFVSDFEFRISDSAFC